MATALGKNRCVKCGKDKSALRCGGCLQEYCNKDFFDHRQELNKQLDEVEVTRDLFRETLSQQTADPKRHPLIQQIDDWERNSIRKIRETAEEARQILLQHTIGQIKQIEVDLNKLTNQLRQGRGENDFYETDLRHWNEELNRLTKELAEPSSISLRQDSTPLINKISVDIMRSGSIYIPNISVNAKWIENGITVAGGNVYGSGINQLNKPYGLYVDDDQTVYVADYSNHRIVEWKNDATSGRVVAGGNGPGNQNNQLNGPADVIVDKENDSLIICDHTNRRLVRWPRQNGTSGETIISDVSCLGVTMDNYGYLYVTDNNKDEVRRWKIGDTVGTLVAGGNGTGNCLNQLNKPVPIFVDQDQSVYVSEHHNHRVTKWTKDAKEGIAVAGGQDAGNSLTQLKYPRGVVIDQLGTVYVADYFNHRVMRWPKGATQGSVIVGGNGSGAGLSQLSYPAGFSFDRQGNLYVVDYNNHRVQKFNIDPNSNL